MGFYTYLLEKRGATPSDPDRDNRTDKEKEMDVQDEALNGPWTHRVTLYCAEPSPEFLKELEGKTEVVGIFVKEKTDRTDKSTVPLEK